MSSIVKQLEPVIEGDEVVEYVVLELPSSSEALLGPGNNVKLMDLSSEKPKIQLEDGTVLEGSYEGSIGTLMLYERHAGDSGQASISQDASSSAPSVKFKGLTETKAVFMPSAAQPAISQPSLPGSNLS